MAVSYKKLFKLMIDKDINEKDFIAKTGLSYATIGKLVFAITFRWKFWRRFVKN